MTVANPQRLPRVDHTVPMTPPVSTTRSSSARIFVMSTPNMRFLQDSETAKVTKLSETAASFEPHPSPEIPACRRSSSEIVRSSPRRRTSRSARKEPRSMRGHRSFVLGEDRRGAHMSEHSLRVDPPTTETSRITMSLTQLSTLRWCLRKAPHGRRRCECRPPGARAPLREHSPLRRGR